MISVKETNGSSEPPPLPRRTGQSADKPPEGSESQDGGSAGPKRASTLHLNMGGHSEESHSDTSYTKDGSGERDGDAPGVGHKARACSIRNQEMPGSSPDMPPILCHKARGHAVKLWNKVKSTNTCWFIFCCGLLTVSSVFIAEFVSPGILIPGRKIQDGLPIGNKLEKPNNPCWTASYKDNSSDVAYPIPPAPPTKSGTTWQTGFHEMMNNSGVVSLTTLSPPPGWNWADPYADVTENGEPLPITLSTPQPTTSLDNAEKCIENPCLHGTCVNKDGGYKCTCSPGWTGQNCQQDIDECTSTPCLHGACVNKAGGYKCTCSPGWTGQNCQQDIDECMRNPWPCQHGTCVNKDGGYKCTCSPGWTGQNCQQDINECMRNPWPCQHGTCVNKDGGYKCTCSPGWTGQNCQQDINECARKPCKHGTCVNKDGGYKCSCSPGWTGQNCQRDIDECMRNPCPDRACVNKDGGYKCACSPGWTGQNCQREINDDNADINECTGKPCQHGHCVNKDGGYKCTCSSGWTGQNCQQGINECTSKPCQHGRCVNTRGGYKCTCSPGWTGQNCQQDINECTRNPCQHGRCENKDGGYKCACSPGWTGHNCQQDINECTSKPCQHGTCVNKNGGYKCTCSPGWTGQNCQQDINECTKNPCQHGTCVNKDGGYRCTCSPGWTGQNCQQGRRCQNGWIEYNKHCYKLMRDKVKWSTANSRCKQHGANLASVQSREENDFIAMLITNAPKGTVRHLVWFGLCRGKGGFSWTDGSDLTYTNWAPGEPNNRAWLSFGQGENCGAMYSKWLERSTMKRGDPGSFPSRTWDMSEHAPRRCALGKGTLHDFPHSSQV
ncbi:hypothetical protein Bbelb_231420 [Branchiostoma belcheri]|nr:hypothetical protein Bbelb_231420 [Branchiostoma belcheri]